MSSTDLTVFRHQGGDIRVVTVNGEPWFVATDVAVTLGLGNPRSSLALLDDDERGVHSVDTLGGAQSVTTVSESGLYSMILRSRKPEARAFKRWVTHEVLPAIRKTGGYMHDIERALPQSYGEALRMLADEVETRSALEAKVAVDAPKVEYVDEFVTPDDVMLFRVAANEIGVGEHELRTALIGAGWVYKTLIGTRWSKSAGRDVKEFEYRAAAAHAEKFRSMPQHNAPRHHNGQVRTTLYIRAGALPAISRRVLSKLTAVSA